MTSYDEDDDYEALEEALNVLWFRTGSSTSDIIWPYLIQWDPVAVDRNREMQIAFLARHGRQSMLQWDDIDVEVIERKARYLLEVIKLESRTGNMAETLY